ncbi:hypothetical protein CDD83_3442 [Cordyceps sp. RAO-2017]|nr:hypothetical protein CDD83_3442 [Cordyceps sp. RAO-2017]
MAQSPPDSDDDLSRAKAKEEPSQPCLAPELALLSAEPSKPVTHKRNARCLRRPPPPPPTAPLPLPSCLSPSRPLSACCLSSLPGLSRLTLFPASLTRTQEQTWPL